MYFIPHNLLLNNAEGWQDLCALVNRTINSINQAISFDTKLHCFYYKITQKYFFDLRDVE